MKLTNVVRVDVREALLRPDLSPLAERASYWFVNVPPSLADGTAVPPGGRWALAQARGLSASTAADPLLRALLGLYAREREASSRAAPHDPNFTGPLEMSWRRLSFDEASARPFANAHCLLLTGSGSLEQCLSDFPVEPVELSPPPPPQPQPQPPPPPQPQPQPQPQPPPQPQPQPQPLLALLKAYGAQQASNEQVLRALMEHPSWLSPVWLFLRGSTDFVAPKMVLYGNEARMPPGVVWLFSDREHADRANQQLLAQGGQLGPYVEGLPGHQVFERLEGAAFEKLNVNIGSPVEETFFVGSGTGGLLALWAKAVGLERALAEKAPDDPTLLRALRDFAGLCTFQSDAGVMLIEKDGQKGVPLFTAIDCAEAFSGSLPEPLRSQFKRVTASGQAIFKVLSQLAIDALFVNPSGPGPRLTLPARVAQAALSVG